MKIFPIKENFYKKESKPQPQVMSFEAKCRVDKGLARFYEANQNRMPITLERYISNLKNRDGISPMVALKNAFEFLNITESIEEVKEIFSFEPLFSKLKNPSESKASIGILRLVKEDAEILELSGEGVLKDKSNLTVYLLRKIFLENKTIKEINNDLENDLNEDLKAEYKFKYPNADYIHKTTLRALGIYGINQEFRNSLRFTQEEYADVQGEKVSQGLLNFWESLSEEERTAKAKKSVEKFEIWWNSLSKNEVLTMIASQKDTLDILKDFKHFQKAFEQDKIEDKAVVNNSQCSKNQPNKPNKHIKVGSDKLKNDELFIKWASNHLKLFIENLSEADKDSLHIKRMQLLVSRWAEMTPAERTEYISKIKSGLEPLRFTMIDAWNHSGSIIKDLYTHLKRNQIYKPSEFIYSPDEFSKSQSEVMTEFWGKYPEHCKTLGLNIIKSNEKVQMAISRGTFDELKIQILRDKNDRIKEFEKVKIVQAPRIDSSIRTELEGYSKMFFDRLNAETDDELIGILAGYDIYTLRKLFSDKSPAKYEEKEKIYNNLKKDLLPKIKDEYLCVFEYTDDPFKLEKGLNQYILSTTREMKLLPKHFLDRFVKIAKLSYRRKESPFAIQNAMKNIDEDSKNSHLAMEIVLGKVLYKITNDQYFMEYSLIDNNKILNDIMNDAGKTLPRKLSYLIYNEKTGSEEKYEMTIYFKAPHLQSLAIAYYSTLREIENYLDICDAEACPEKRKQATEEFLKNLSPNNNEYFKNAILEKIRYWGLLR